MASPAKTSQHAEESIADTSSSSLDTTHEDIEATSTQMTNSSDTPLRPTPKPRKTINLKANGSNGTPSEGHVPPNPKPRVPQKRVPSMQEPDSSPSAAESSPGMPNGNSCEVKGVNGVRPSPRERPCIPARRLTLDEGDLIPKASPRTSPPNSPKRSPVLRSKSAAPDTHPGGDTVAAGSSTKGESDKLRNASPQRHSLPVTSDSSSSPNDCPPTSANDVQGNGESVGKESTNEGSIISRPKPSISPKKPNLAMVGKRKTVASAYNISVDRDADVKSDIAKKPPPQRPSLPPKRPPGSPSPGSKPKGAIENTCKPKLNNQVPSSQTDQASCNKPDELSNNVPSRVKLTSENLQTEGIAETQNMASAVSPDSPPANSRTEYPKMPAFHPRRVSKWNPVAPPRRVQSMSESDPNSELSVEKLKSNNMGVPEGGKDAINQDDLPKVEESRDGTGLMNDISEGERSTLKRNRRNIKSCDYLGYANMRAAKEDKESNGELKNKPKPPRPPPPSKPTFQPTTHVPPPRPKAMRAKTFDSSTAAEMAKSEPKESQDQSMQTNAKLNTGGDSGTTESNKPTKDSTLDRSEWEFVDLTPEERRNINMTIKQGSAEQNKAEDSQKFNSDVQYVNFGSNSQSGENEKGKLKSNSGQVAQDSKPAPAKKPEGEAVSQLKMRKTLPPTPSKRNSMESTSALLNKSANCLPGTAKEGSSHETPSGRPLSQGSPINGRSPNTSPKKALRDRGRNSSPKRPSCPPPPPPPGTGSPIATPPAVSASPASVSSPPPKSYSPVPSEPTSTTPTVKPKRPAPPRPNFPPDKGFALGRSSSPKPAAEAAEDQTNIYTEANSHINEDEEDSDGDRDHEYELIPDPRKRTLPREKPPSSSDEETTKTNANRASGYFDDGTYLEPKKPDQEEDENEYVYPEFKPGDNSAINTPSSPPPLPPNPEHDQDQVFPSPDPSPLPSKSRRSSGTPPRRKAPKKPRRSHSIQSDVCYDSNSGDNGRATDDTGNER